MPGRLLNYGSYLGSALVAGLEIPRPDVVVALTDPPVIGAIALAVARRHRIPFVQVYMDIYPDVGMALGRMDHPLVVRAWRRFNRVIRSRAACVVAIGRDMIEKLEREGLDPMKAAFIPNWDEGSHVDARAARRTRTAMGWTDRFVVMHAGNIGLAQNLGCLVDAAGLLMDRSDVLVTLLGDGAARRQLENQVRVRTAGNVSFLPPVPKEEARRLVAAADLHVVSLCPGLWGSVVPSKIYGIMAAGKPFVAAVDPGSEPARLIEEHRCGIRVDPGDGEGLAMAIRAIHDRPDHQMGRRGRLAFSSKYTREAATVAYRDLLEAVAAGRASLPRRDPKVREVGQKL
jgi:glycosyltransferase involved in cell wall biosynthesis